MTDTIQDRIRQHLRGENDEPLRILFWDAVERIDELEALQSVAFRTYRAPPEAWDKS